MSKIGLFVVAPFNKYVWKDFIKELKKRNDILYYCFNYNDKSVASSINFVKSTNPFDVIKIPIENTNKFFSIINESDNEVEKNIGYLQVAINKFCHENDAEVFVAYHRGSVLKKHINEKIPNSICEEFIHEDVPIHNALKKLVEAIIHKEDNKVNCFDEVCKIIKAGKPVPVLSSLKHQIAHLFLSLDMDLQGIADVKKDVKVDYLRDVLNEKPDTYYRQKLADLQFMVTGKDFVDGKELECKEPVSGGFVTSALKSEDLPDNKTALDVIKNKMDDIKAVKNELSTLSQLCGLKDGGKISADPGSEIFKYMCLLDCKVKKRKEDKTIDMSDIEAVLTFFESQPWEINDADTSPVKSFHDWFCALDDCLERIREAMK